VGKDNKICSSTCGGGLLKIGAMVQVALEAR
jgi:hypothetical protein